LESDGQGAAPEELKDSRRVSVTTHDEMLGLGQHRFARRKRRRTAAELGACPRVMAVSSVEDAMTGPASTMVLSATTRVGCQGVVEISWIRGQIRRAFERARQIFHEIQTGGSISARPALAEALFQAGAGHLRFADALSRRLQLQVTQQRAGHLQ